MYACARTNLFKDKEDRDSVSEGEGAAADDADAAAVDTAEAVKYRCVITSHRYRFLLGGHVGTSGHWRKTKHHHQCPLSLSLARHYDSSV